ncbi:MAG: hypothetical protein AB8F26_00985 [Phycisphaerales bacterium]
MSSRPQNTCPECKYDLRGMPATPQGFRTCSECGTTCVPRQPDDVRPLNIKRTGIVPAGIVSLLLGIIWFVWFFADPSSWPSAALTMLGISIAAFVLGIPAEIAIRVSSQRAGYRSRSLGPAVLAAILWNTGPALGWFLTANFWAGVIASI